MVLKETISKEDYSMRKKVCTFVKKMMTVVDGSATVHYTYFSASSFPKQRALLDFELFEN